jgi:lysophospholipase L1-like esterase
MDYLALGDSISIDDYTDIEGGGAVNQFAFLIRAQRVQDLTQDGCTTTGVLERLNHVSSRPDIVTLTAGGNDFLQGAFDILSRSAPSQEEQERLVRQVLANLRAIAERLAAWRCPVILNTIYDPSDGDDAVTAEFGLPPESRTAFNAINAGIRQIAEEHAFLLSDLEVLFRRHGARSPETWITLNIEPNYEGATAIAHHWNHLYRRLQASGMI